MSSFVWMRALESTAWRYDRGIQLLSSGRIDAVYRLLAELAVPAGRAPSPALAGALAAGRGAVPAAVDVPVGADAGAADPQRGSPSSSYRGEDGRSRVLDLGCGTGGVALACAGRGAHVVGIDRNGAMLEVARTKTAQAGPRGRVEWIELAAAEIEDRFPARSFDAVVSCLAFSEMSEDEQSYALGVVRTRLEPGGSVILADEVEPRDAWRGCRYRLGRLPRAAVVYLLTQATTRPVRGLPQRLRGSGFVDVQERRMWGDAFCVVSARAPGASAAASPTRRSAADGRS